MFGFFRTTGLDVLDRDERGRTAKVEAKIRLTSWCNGPGTNQKPAGLGGHLLYFAILL